MSLLSFKGDGLWWTNICSCYFTVIDLWEFVVITLANCVTAWRGKVMWTNKWSGYEAAWKNLQLLTWTLGKVHLHMHYMMVTTWCFSICHVEMTTIWHKCGALGCSVALINASCTWKLGKLHGWTEYASKPVTGSSKDGFWDSTIAYVSALSMLITLVFERCSNYRNGSPCNTMDPGNSITQITKSGVEFADWNFFSMT